MLCYLWAFNQSIHDMAWHGRRGVAFQGPSGSAARGGGLLCSAKLSGRTQGPVRPSLTPGFSPMRSMICDSRLSILDRLRPDEAGDPHYRLPSELPTPPIAIAIAI